MVNEQLVPIKDQDSAIAGGWMVELDGNVVAELTQPMLVVGSQFWYSFVVVPTSSDPSEIAKLFTKEFWHSDKIIFRSRKFGVIAPNALPSDCPPSPDTHRILVRGLHLQIEPRGSLLDTLWNFIGKLRP